MRELFWADVNLKQNSEWRDDEDGGKEGSCGTLWMRQNEIKSTKRPCQRNVPLIHNTPQRKCSSSSRSCTRQSRDSPDHLRCISVSDLGHSLPSRPATLRESEPYTEPLLGAFTLPVLLLGELLLVQMVGAISLRLLGTLTEAPSFTRFVRRSTLVLAAFGGSSILTAGSIAGSATGTSPSCFSPPWK